MFMFNITISLPQIWNDELAVLAQQYAEQCIFDHNPLRTNQQRIFRYIGENLAVNNRQRNYTREVERWYREVSEYDFVEDSCTEVCGHYTQVSVHLLLMVGDNNGVLNKECGVIVHLDVVVRSES